MSTDIRQGFWLGSWKVEPLRGAITGANGDTNHLGLKVMDVFVYLAEHANEMVSRDQLLEKVWAGNDAADELLTGAISDLRRALHDDPNDPEYIETIPKRGYRLICRVTPLAANTELLEVTSHSPNGWRHRRRNLAIAAAIASIIVAIILIANPQIRDQLLQTNEGPTEKSVAVLPFVDMGEDGDQQYLGDGVAEELIHLLSNLPDLRVTARTSSFAFRDSNDDIRQIGSKLNVATILEGSVRKDGDQIRITSQLVDTRNGYHIWSQTFDRRTTDLFSIQNEIAVAVARTFEYRDLDALATDGRVAQADELQSYDLSLLGWHQLHKNSPSGAMLAIEYFERAIKIDPSFAHAYVGLSESYSQRYSIERDQELLDKAESAAEYALLLDGQSADAFSALGHVNSIKNDYSGAEQAYRKALALNPNDAHASMYLAFHIAMQGGEEEALVMVKKALELHPMSGRLNNWMGNYHNTMPHRDWDMAFKYYKLAMERDPDYRGSYRNVGLYYKSIGQLDQAIPYFRKVVDLTTGVTKAGLNIGLLASAYVDIGDYESAVQLIRRTKELEPNHLGATNSEIHLQLARGDYSAAGDIVHRMVPANIDDYLIMGLMAFYELVIGDIDHAEEIYARLAATQEPDTYGQVNLYRGNELSWGMLGAVNLAYLHKSNRDTEAARELLVKAREYIESRIDHSRFIPSVPYVLAQIAAVEGNNDAAIEYVREAVEAGWTKAWFGRIDPIMADLRKDARYIQMLEELEDKLLEMREHPKVLASNEP